MSIRDSSFFQPARWVDHRSRRASVPRKLKGSSQSFGVAALALLIGACVPTLPQAPDLEPVLSAYAMPSAFVDGEILGAVADEIAKAANDIEDSELFEQILDVIIDVEEELEAAISRTCTGGANSGNSCTDDRDCPDATCGDANLVLGAACSGGTNDGGDCSDDADCPGGGMCVGGVTLPSPTGAVGIDYICPGWDERQFDEGYDDSPDPTNGAIQLFIALDGGGIGQVAWGKAAECLYLVPNEGNDCRAAGCSEVSFNGDVALDLGPDWLGKDLEEVPVTFVVEGNIGIDGDDARINQSFRVILAAETGLEILVDIGDPALTETFNYIFAADAQAIRAANGLFGCSLEERRCFEQTCEGGTNDGNVCVDDADCPEGTCERTEAFSW